ncbi:exonuclease domain-containing protein [Mycobacteroides abscessus]|uniref:exonuclease domain-containing protein n=1 Tax=Mycobacteroides abscessus TaxID=36809 RepID=UPI0009295214|nr:exonuclease domain-containing protein [Mycobacteroides abscessus]SHP26591.1 DNA polymerase III epsilon subunit-like 3'-5' exonuclease [Mycobacteroides abscessus subsp. bolletii]SHR53349.1 DNA polymerase III epsilon subunit-like 3'-5' exonuclease [Mycobacteroides abscessus subsp. bolletii]SHS30775.1 DNA polymerase III epsilon subunit-like 3'-5' exonuclease [Mycobacteroides abscessus subsp. bolletii]SKF72360.1 DNA polymerase III epsilon subunit-like 3'-5' exonuclease [Mycobacteroides abscessus
MAPPPWYQGPLLAIDLETTDVDPHNDRIVTASVIRINPLPGQRPTVEHQTWLADPGVEIPADATELHGITTAHARENGQPAGAVVAEVAAYLATYWTATVPLCVFNATFDLTMLDAELQRHHQHGLSVSGPVIDPQCVDRKVDSQLTTKRTLYAVCTQYGIKLDKAHDGKEDALAAARLAWHFGKNFPEIGSVSVSQLHGDQIGWFYEQEHDFASYLDRRAKAQAAANNSTEAERLRARAARVREAAGHWPIQPAHLSTHWPARRRKQPSVRTARPGAPPKSHSPWSTDEENLIRERWLAAESRDDPTTLIAQIAETQGRTPGAIRSRLLRIHCHPDQPGCTCSPEEAAQIQAQDAAKYQQQANAKT